MNNVELATHKGLTYVVGQVNNAMLYPGLGLGAIVSRARRISDGMFAAAASAVSSIVAVSQPRASLLPHIDDLRSVSVTVAEAVAETAARRKVWPESNFPTAFSRCKMRCGSRSTALISSVLT